MKTALFFTLGNGLQTWKDVGMFEREVALYQELAKDIDIIYFVTYQKDDKKFASDLADNIVILPKKLKVSNFVYSFLVPFVYRKELKNCDLYKTNQMLGAWSAIISKWLYRKKLIVRTGFTASLFYIRDKKIFKYAMIRMIETFSLLVCDRYFVASQKDKDYIGKNNKKVVVVPNYVETDRLSPIDRPVDRKCVSLLLVGRLEAQKNIHSLLEAVKDLDVELTIVGKGSLEKELKSQAKDSLAKIQFIEKLSHTELGIRFQATDIFVLPSLFEGTPKVLLEAMSCEAAVIATDVPGITAIIHHKENGYLCKTDSESLKSAILELMNNSNLREKMGKGARETILKTFSLKYVRSLEKDVYDTVLKKV